MKKGKKLIALLMALVLVMGLMTACGSDKKEEAANTATTDDAAKATDDAAAAAPTDVKLLVWGPQEEQTAYEGYGDSLLGTLCEQFAAEHPEWNITFEYAVCAEGDARTELQKDAAAGADVFYFAGDQTAELQANGVLYPLTIGIDEIKADNLEDPINAATIDGALYGIPFSPNSWFMYYDKSKFTEEEVKSLDTMMAKDLGDGVYNFSLDLDNGWYNAAFFLGAGCQLFGTDGKDATVCTFNNETGKAVGEYMIGLGTNPKFLMQTDENIALSYMKEGKLGAFCSGTWDANNVKEALGENFGAAQLPTFKVNGTDNQISSFKDYKYIGVNANTQYPEAAQALAAYLGGKDSQTARFTARSITPTLQSIASGAEVAAAPESVALNNQMALSTIQSSIPQMSNYWEPAAAFGIGIYNKEITKDNLQEQLDAFVDNVLTSIN